MNKIQHEYSAMAKSLHWLTAIMILGQYLIGITLDYTEWKSLHFQIGYIIVILVIWRIIWRITHVYPELDAQIKGHGRLLAHVGHYTLYLLMVLVLISGFLRLITKGEHLNVLGFNFAPLMHEMSKTERTPYKLAHEYLAHLFILLIALHALAAFAHQFLSKIPCLSRMLPKSVAKYIEE
jgi:cytochrome b561